MPQGLRVLDEVFLQYAQQLDWLLMLLPNPLRLPHINWLQILVRRRSGCELPPYPLDGALLVRDEEFWLLQHVRLHALLFVLRHLARQEVHIISYFSSETKSSGCSSTFACMRFCSYSDTWLGRKYISSRSG